MQDTSTWNPNVHPSSSLEQSAFDPFNFLKAPDDDRVPEDDEPDFPPLGSMPFLSSQQQQNVIVPPAAQSAAGVVAVQAEAVAAFAHTFPSTSAIGAAEDMHVPMAYPVSTDGVVENFLTNPWANPEYQPLIQWVVAASDAELIKPFHATVPPHLKPPSWKGFRKDDTKCMVNLGKELGRATERRIVLDAKNLFMVNLNKKKNLESWDFMCPGCKKIGHSKTGKDPGDKQFNSLGHTYPDRQYLYQCASCKDLHQNFRPASMMELASKKAEQLGMDILEYLLGDYDHVVDQIKKKFSNLDKIEDDSYTDKVKQTRRENLEPFMGCRFPKPDKKEKTKSAMAPTMFSPSGPPGPPSSLPMPSGGSFVPQLPSAKPPGKRPFDPTAPTAGKGARKARKRPSGSEVQVTMNKRQCRYPEVSFYKIIQSRLKTSIDSGTLTREDFDFICTHVETYIDAMQETDFSFQDGSRFSVQDGNMNDPDYLLKNCNKAIARLFSDLALVSQELKDDCMDALGFGDEEIAALLSKPLPSAQPADRSEQVLKIVPAASGDKLDTLRRAGLQLASPTTASAFTTSPIGIRPANFAPRNKSPLAPGFATTTTTFAPVRDYESLAPADEPDDQPLTLAHIKCICVVPPPESDETIQCSLCKQWSHRVCYSIHTKDDIKDWCCKHCKPAVYQDILVAGWTVCPLAGKKNRLPCMCNNYYPLPFAAVGTDIDYDDTNWLECSVDSCSRLMHSKCYHPFERGKVHVMCPTCQEEDDEDDD